VFFLFAKVRLLVGLLKSYLIIDVYFKTIFISKNSIKRFKGCNP
jgi:hypothetical protein